MKLCKRNTNWLYTKNTTSEYNILILNDGHSMLFSKNREYTFKNKTIDERTIFFKNEQCLCVATVIFLYW